MKRFALALLFLPLFAGAQTIIEKTDNYLLENSKQKSFSGHVLIEKNGQIIFQKEYGKPDSRNKKLSSFKSGDLTVYIIASCPSDKELGNIYNEVANLVAATH